MREVTLPSGTKLVVNVAPFLDAKLLFQLMAKEWKDVQLDSTPSLEQMTQMFMRSFSSIDVERALWPCLLRSLYNGMKIVPDTFEPETSRQDFIPTCLEVVSDNIVPFTSGLFSGLETQSRKPNVGQK